MDTRNLDAIQTAGILFIGIAIAYVIWKLESAIRQGTAEIKLMLIAQKETFDAQAQINAAIADVARQIAEFDSRLTALEKPKAPPRPRKPKTPPANIGWLQGTRRSTIKPSRAP